MYIITASYDHNGTICDTSNHESLGDWYGHEFATEDDASQAADELAESPASLDYSVTYTVEDIGITEAEVASKSGDEWWSAVVGIQTPAEFMACAEQETPRDAALAYLGAVVTTLNTVFRNEDAKSDLADKLVEVIEAQAPTEVDENPAAGALLERFGNELRALTVNDDVVTWPAITAAMLATVAASFTGLDNEISAAFAKLEDRIVALENGQ